MDAVVADERAGRVWLTVGEKIICEGLEQSSSAEQELYVCKMDGRDATRAGVALKRQTWESDKSHRDPFPATEGRGAA